MGKARRARRRWNIQQIRKLRRRGVCPCEDVRIEDPGPHLDSCEWATEEDDTPCWCGEEHPMYLDGHAAVVEAQLRTDIPVGMVRRAHQTAAFLSLYYSGGGISSSAADPCPTIPTKDRLALILVELETCDGPATLATVEIDGQLWIVVDICMRMLTPRELARAQGFADSYWLPPKKSDAIARIGNSVVPQCAEAIVRANLPSATEMAAK